MKKLLSIFALLLSLSAFAQTQKAVGDKIIGIVGDRIILLSDIKNAVADAQRQGQTLPPGAECIVLEQALVSKVLALQAERDSLPVTDEEVEAELDRRIRFFVNQYGSIDELERIAGKTVFQIKEEARESTRESKLAEAMQQKIVGAARITPTEVRQFFERSPADSLPFLETELEIGQIIIHPKPARELERYIMDELANYKRQVEGKLVSFEQLAKDYSDEPAAKQTGGMLPEINRQSKDWDPAFMAAAFKLKEGEISAPVKSKFGIHIIQMLQRNGDNAIFRHILRRAPVTDDEIAAATSKLDSVRANLISGTIDFNTAAGKYSTDENAKFSGPFILSRDGDTYNTLDELDKDVIAAVEKLKVGEYSQPQPFSTEANGRGVRLLYLRNRTEPHRLNMRDDYSRISAAALQDKKSTMLETWLTRHIPGYYVMIDPSVDNCAQLDKWVSKL